MHYLIGVDMGTTNIKAVIFDENGVSQAEARRPTPTQAIGKNGAIYDPEELWRLVSAILREASEKLAASEGDNAVKGLCGIAVTGMGEAGVPLDENGGPLYPVIAWYDRRTEESVLKLREMVPDDRVLSLTGLRNQYIFTANKLLWLHDNEPELFRRMRRWHCVPDYITFRLSGASGIDHSLCCRTMLFDPVKKDWAGELLDAVGISRGVLPMPVPSGSLIGTLTASASAATGLPEGMGVYAGGHDHICGALACGVWDSNTLLDSSGTSEEVLLATEDPAAAMQYGQKGYNVGCHVRPGRFYLAGGIPASGASVDWSIRTFPTEEAGTPLAHGLMFLPHLRGSSSPERSPLSSGSFVGLRDSHTCADLRQAVCEGVCYEMRLLTDELGGARRAVSIGGAVKNASWLRAKANILGTCVEVPVEKESTALGAALLAGIGAGLYRDADHAFRMTYREGQRVEPDPELREHYERQYGIFRELAPALKGLNRELEMSRSSIISDTAIR